MSPAQYALKGRGIYLTEKELRTIKSKIPVLATMGLSDKEKAVFDKIQKKIKNLDRKVRRTEDVWLSPAQAKFLIAWKEAALEGKITMIGGKTGLAVVPPDLIIKKWKDIFKERMSSSHLNALVAELQRKNIDLRQANVGIVKMRKLAYLSDIDKKVIELRTINKLKYKDIAKKLDISPKTVKVRISFLKRAGYKL